MRATITSITRTRAGAGLPAYTLADDLVAVAARHAAHLARDDSLYHNPHLATEVHGWQAVGENVGYGADAAQIHHAFMDSPPHRSNILDHDFTQVGVGAARNVHGALYIVEVFRQPEQHPPRFVPTRLDMADRKTTRRPVSEPIPPRMQPAPPHASAEPAARDASTWHDLFQSMRRAVHAFLGLT